MQKHGLILLMISVTFALLITWLNNILITQGGLQLAEKIRQIDYYLSDFTLLVTSPDGNMRYHITAQHLIHQQSSGASEIFKPQIQARDNPDMLIRMSAESAQQPLKNGPITLQGEVMALAEDSQHKPRYAMSTRDLTYDPLTQQVSTDAGVLLESANGRISGTGLLSRLNEEELKILSNVHAEFKP